MTFPEITQYSKHKGSTIVFADWMDERKLNALTHILIHPTTHPSLHSQFFIAAQIPGGYFNWDYPPPSPSAADNVKWGLSQFMRLGLPASSWRSKCPYHLPPPSVWAEGVEEGKWAVEERMNYVRMRLRRKKMEINVNPLIPILVPNLLLFSLLFWDPVRLE